MTLSSTGLAFIKSFEGLRNTAYRDSGGVLTIGYGHTGGVQPGDTCTEAQASTWLTGDVTGAERAVNCHVSVPLTQNQFDALVSFAYNVGGGAFINSTLLRLINAGDFDAAAQQFPTWDHIEGVEIAGLERRRAAEAQLFSA